MSKKGRAERRAVRRFNKSNPYKKKGCLSVIAILAAVAMAAVKGWKGIA